MGIKLVKWHTGPRITVRRPQDALAMLRAEIQDWTREHFLAVYLDSRHKPIYRPFIVSVGTLNASLVHPREVFRPAVLANAAALIVAHNHPSGHSEPSRDDLDLTARLDACAELMGIALLDHLILGDPGDGTLSGWTSVREYGWPAPRNSQVHAAASS